MTTKAEPSTPELVRQARDGDEYAKNELVRRYLNRVFRLANKNASVTSEVEDVGESVLKSVIVRLEDGRLNHRKFESEKEFWKFLVSVTLHKVYNRIGYSNPHEWRAVARGFFKNYPDRSIGYYKSYLSLRGYERTEAEIADCLNRFKWERRAEELVKQGVRTAEDIATALEKDGFEAATSEIGLFLKSIDKSGQRGLHARSRGAGLVKRSLDNNLDMLGKLGGSFDWLEMNELIEQANQRVGHGNQRTNLRQRRVLEMLLLGHSRTEIAEKLDCSAKTIGRDVDEIRDVIGSLLEDDSDS